MCRCLFATDLHGRISRYDALFDLIDHELPDAVFLGGDLLASGSLGVAGDSDGDFLTDVFEAGFARLRATLGQEAPEVFLILGNDDGRAVEPWFLERDAAGLWRCVHGVRARFRGHDVYGYSCVPPTPFLCKDWERYDVSRYVDPGCTAPDGDAGRAVGTSGTIESELTALVGDRPLDRAILLCHGPPYDTLLDRAALDGRMHEHVPLDVHVGSIALRRLIERRRPMLTLHGHVHESARLTGSWRDKIGPTCMFNAAHDGPELAVVRFRLDDLDRAERVLI